MTKLTWFSTHPIYYQTKLISILNKHIELRCVFLNDISMRSYFDVEFRRTVDFSRDLKLDFEHLFVESDCAAINYTKTNYVKLVKLLLTDKSEIWVVTGWNHFAMFVITFFGYFRSKRLIMRSEASDQFRKIRRPFRKVFDRIFFKAFDIFWTIGTHNKEFYKCRGVPEDKIADGFYAVDTDQGLLDKKTEVLKNMKSDKLKLIYVGKLTKRKNIQLIIDSFRTSQFLRDRYELIIVGDGEEAKIIKNLKLENMKWLGFLEQSELINELLKADIFVIPSFKEMWGLVVNEAMMCSCIVLASYEVGSAIDLIDEGTNGYIFDPKNPGSLTIALTLLAKLTYPEIEIMKSNSREKISNWNFDNSVSNLMKKIK